MKYNDDDIGSFILPLPWESKLTHTKTRTDATRSTTVQLSDSYWRRSSFSSFSIARFASCWPLWLVTVCLLPCSVYRLSYSTHAHTQTHAQSSVHRPRAQRRLSLICLCPRRTSEFQRLKLTFVAGQTLGPSGFVVGH